jgi:hypothetical protein
MLVSPAVQVLAEQMRACLDTTVVEAGHQSVSCVS